MQRLILSAMLAVPITHAAMVLRVDIDSVVHPITVEILAHALDRAAAQKMDLVVIRLDTPGGLMDASRELVQKMMASPVPVVTYVGPGGAQLAQLLAQGARQAPRARGEEIMRARVLFNQDARRGFGFRGHLRRASRRRGPRWLRAARGESH